MSTVEENYVNNIWALSNPLNLPLSSAVQKSQFVYRYTREEYMSSLKFIDKKRRFLKDIWSDIYQLIGLFSVFQGVWFQGVTQLVALHTCRFSIIPIALSVLVSVATLGGLFVNFERVKEGQVGFYKLMLESKIIESRLSGFGRHGLEINLKEIDKSSKASVLALRTLFNAQLVLVHQIMLFVLGVLVIFSGLFAWFIYAMMCDRFP